MAPLNGVILAAYAQDAFARAPTGNPHALPATLARRALIAEPTAADALTVLGFQAQLRGDIREADRIFKYSVALTRRELRPRLWAINRAVSRGDIAGALRDYDIALRTSSDASGILLPSLTAAMTEPRIRAALIPILATNPVWKENFLGYAANSGIAPLGVTALFMEGSAVGLDVGDDRRAALVNSLMAQNKPDEAWEYYRTFRLGAQRHRSRDPSFTLVTKTPAVFDWQVGTDKRLSAAVLRDANGGLLDFAAPPSVGGEVVSQTQLLPPGQYRLAGRSRGINQPYRSRPYWLLACQGGGELGRVQVPNSDQDAGRFSARFIVPQGCKTQTLSLVIRSTDAMMGVSGQIQEARVVPEG